MSPAHRGNSSRAQSVAVFVCLGVALYVSWLLIRPFLGVLTWAVVMVVVFYPVHRAIEQRLGSPGWSAAASTVLVIVTILAPTAFVMTATVAELGQMAEGMPSTLGEWLNPAHPASGRFVRWIERFVSLEPLRDPDFVASTLEGWGTSIASGSLRLVGGAISVFVQMALIVFTMFFLFKDARLVRTTLYEMVPIENRRLRALFVRTRDVVKASVYGTLFLAIIQGILGGLAFLVLGLPSPFLWGIVMMVAALVPILGAFVVWIPAAIYLASTGHVWQAVGLAAWGALVVGMADNVLRPVLVGNKTQMHELLVFFGVLGGLTVFGAIGLIMGPVIFAVTLALIQALREVGAPAEVGGQAA